MQDSPITNLIRTGTTARIFTTNGYQLQGRILSETDELLVLESGPVEERTLQYIYKHAISTVSPLKGVAAR